MSKAFSSADLRFSISKLREIEKAIRARVEVLLNEFGGNAPEYRYLSKVGGTIYLVYYHISNNLTRTKLPIRNDSVFSVTEDDFLLARSIAKFFRDSAMKSISKLIQSKVKKEIAVIRCWPPLLEEVEALVIEHSADDVKEHAGPETLLFGECELIGFDQTANKPECPAYLRRLATEIHLCLKGYEPLLETLVKEWSESHHGEIKLLPLPEGKKLSRVEKAAILCAIVNVTGVDGGLCPNARRYPQSDWRRWLSFHNLTGLACGISASDAKVIRAHLDAFLIEVIGSKRHKHLDKPNESGKRAMGRPRASDTVQESEQDLADRWDYAKSTGAFKPEFARENGLKLAEFDRLLDRVSARRRRSDK